MAEKDLRVALVISLIFTGLGIAYAGNVRKGIIIFAIAILLNISGMWVSPILSKLSILLWIYGLYATYMEVKAVNGE